MSGVDKLERERFSFQEGEKRRKDYFLLSRSKSLSKFRNERRKEGKNLRKSLSKRKDGRKRGSVYV